jgi:predicted transglutaminase-like cysteine proteinase
MNRGLLRGADTELYGVEDYWTAPVLDGRPVYGDCEDYALGKRRALLAAGVPASALSIAVVETPWKELHAVLLVSTDKGDLVLDNLNTGIVFWHQAGYRWIQRQQNGDAFNWVAIAAIETQGGKSVR